MKKINQKQLGFSILEVTITLLLLALTMVTAYNFFRPLYQKKQLDIAVHKIITQLEFLRTQAIIHQTVYKAKFENNILQIEKTNPFHSYQVVYELGFEEKMVVFFLQLEEDFFSSGLDNSSKDNIANNLSFESWLWNNDEATFDKKISSYQFQKNTNQISRKIGAEINFTSLLQQVENFEFEAIQQQNLFCLKIAIQSVFDENFRKQVFCRHF